MVEEDVKKICNERALRVLILVSVALQLMLSLLRNLRKYDSRTLIRTTLWVVYFLAYAVIPAALGITAQTALETHNTSRSIPKHHKSSTSELMSFWAPFLLLHLGGPDSINGCYSSEDNEFWLRHLTSVVFQSGVALYILLSSWTRRGSHLPLLSVLVYAAGCIKCFQRVQAQRLGSIGHLRAPMHSPSQKLQMPTPIREPVFGPNEHYLQETMLGTDNYLVDRVEESQDFVVEIVDENADPSFPVVHASAENQSKEVLEAYNLLQTFKRLLVDLANKDRDTSASSSYFSHLDSALEASRVVDIELGLAYDLIYTKASVDQYTCKGLILHATRLLLLLLVLVGFHFTKNMENCRAIDVAITYVLIAVEISKEIFAVITMLRSDRADLWLNKPSKQRLSNSVTQTDLPSVALVEKPSIFPPLQNSFGVDEYLTRLINKQFVEFICRSDPNASCIRHGSFSVHEDERDTLLWSINVGDRFETNRIECKHVSEHLVNLLISNPEMLPMGTNVIGYHDARADVKRFFKTEGTITEEAKARRKLIEVGCKELFPSIRIGDGSKFVLFDSCELALSIKQYVFRSSPFPGNKSLQPTSSNFLQASASSEIVPSVLKKHMASAHLSYWM